MPWRGFRPAVATLVLAATAALTASPSEAARYHRFKRVNGEWIEGRFLSHSHRASVRSARRESALRRQEGRGAAGRIVVARRYPETTASLQPLAVAPPLRPAEKAARDLSTALHQKAAERAAQLAEGSPVAGNGAEPVSVTLNFKTGMKATSFRNGDVSKEPFDPAALRALAASPPPRDPR